MPSIVLYTTNCPKCVVLKKKLEAKGMDYETITDVATMKAKGISHVPILEVDGTLYNFTMAVEYLREVA